MYSLRKSKKGFTLIELMVVVMIIGVLVLLGLRAYSSQKERAMNSIVKANAGTMQTMLVGYLGDMDIKTNVGLIESVEDALGLAAEVMIENMVNPYDNTRPVYRYSAGGTSVFDATTAASGYYGQVDVLLVSPNILYVNGRGRDSELLLLPNSLPANKY
jgi:prepilin-type N-terminal cleavage/methylation domain-containing protein